MVEVTRGKNWLLVFYAIECILIKFLLFVNQKYMYPCVIVIEIEGQKFSTKIKPLKKLMLISTIRNDLIFLASCLIVYIHILTVDDIKTFYFLQDSNKICFLFYFFKIF